MIQRVQRLGLIFALLFLTVGCDQVTKVLARDTLTVTGPLEYFRGMIRLEHAENPGAFLSVGSQLPEEARFWIFTVSIFVFLTATLCFLLLKDQLDLSATVCVTLLIAGGYGNLIDRVAKGTVTDFLNFGFGSLRTGIFNIADMAIVTAVLLLILLPHFKRRFV